MAQFNFIITLCLCLPIAQGQSNIAGNALWNSTGKALTTKEFESKYSLSKNSTCERPYSFVSEAKLNGTGEKVAVKTEDVNLTICYLPQEVHVYEDLKKRSENLLYDGFPNMLDHGCCEKGTKRVLVTSKLGSNLDSHFRKENWFGWDELRFIATSAIDRLQFLHAAGYIHQDIRPKVFAYGIEDPEKVNRTAEVRLSFKNQIYLKDFGCATKYRDANKKCIKQSAAANHTVGIEPFSSRTFRQGLSQSRRDDMERLGYTLLMISGVKLPWHYESNKTKVKEEQSRLCDDLDVLSICRQSEIIDKRIQAAFLTYFMVLKRLFIAKDGFSRDPDYFDFKKCFREDPEAYYTELTGKRKEESKSKREKLVDGVKQKLSSNKK